MLFIAVAGLIAMAGCKTQDSRIQCDVDPDSVFGEHYDAWDFQIWYVLNDSDSAYNTLLSMMNIDSSVSDLGFGLRVAPADTAAVMVKALDACMDYVDKVDALHAYIPVWLQDEVCMPILLFTYGIAAPDTETPILLGSEVASAKTYYDRSGAIEVAMTFKKEAADRWAQITDENIGRNVAIMLGEDREGRVLSAPMIMAQITGGRCSVSGLSIDEACALAQILSER